MKILWITNTLFPDICREIGIQPPVIGGWMYASARAILDTNANNQLAVAALYEGDHLKEVTLNGITYFLLPTSGSNGSYNVKLETYWKEVQRKFLPDVVHIHGTEYPHGLAHVKACGKRNVVVSVQGLVSVYERYYLGGIDFKNLLVSITLRDCLRFDNIFSQRKRLQQQGILEKEMMQSVDHIIGRTAWDKAHSWALNSQANYHFCNETLRNEFYQYGWDINRCETHSVFLSQVHYPIKGLQQIIKALPIILKQHPDTIIYVAGNDFANNRGWRLNGFGKYISALMKQNGVTNKIIFTGVLSEKEMCNRYLASHVFVCPSSIENSSNSLGEAQLLGVPCVASYVGGTADMVADGETGLLYRFEEVEMLAAAVCRIFANDSLAMKLSEQSRKVAATRHDKLINSKRLNNIYQAIYKDAPH